MSLFTENRWRHYRRPIGTQVPRAWQGWLYDEGSLTKRLLKLSGHDFQVGVLRNEWAIPQHHEWRALKIKPRQQAIIREVQLIGKGQVWVTARSVIPASTLRGQQRQLRNVGTKPLGALLFSHRNMRRGVIQVASVGKQHTQWARRSVFYLDNRPLLVAEAFSPQLKHQ